LLFAIVVVKKTIGIHIKKNPIRKYSQKNISSFTLYQLPTYKKRSFLKNAATDTISPYKMGIN